MFDEKIRSLFIGRLQRVAQDVQDTDEIQDVISRLTIDAPLRLKDLCIIKSAVETKPGEAERTTDKLLEELEKPIRDAYKENVENIPDLVKSIQTAFQMKDEWPGKIKAITMIKSSLMEIYYELSEVQL